VFGGVGRRHDRDRRRGNRWWRRDRVLEIVDLPSFGLLLVDGFDAEADDVRLCRFEVVEAVVVGVEKFGSGGGLDRHLGGARFVDVADVHREVFDSGRDDRPRPDELGADRRAEPEGAGENRIFVGAVVPADFRIEPVFGVEDHPLTLVLGGDFSAFAVLAEGEVLGSAEGERRGRKAEDAEDRDRRREEADSSPGYRSSPHGANLPGWTRSVKYRS
jgi:hypothetical protein